jgi:L-alanine-DL-glutamate epimerase-like enolase superfamily enzyme
MSHGTDRRRFLQATAASAAGILGAVSAGAQENPLPEEKMSNMSNASLCIERVIAHVLEMPMSFTYSSGTYTHGRAIVWEIITKSHTGIGECLFASEKSVPGIQPGLGKALAGGLKEAIAPWVARLIGRNAVELEALLEPMPRTLNWDLLVVREGLSIGLYDLVGKAYGLPVHVMLGGMRRNRIPGMPVIHVGPPEVMVRRSKKWAEAGYRFLKVKFRGNMAEDTEAIAAIRKQLGSKVSLVVDANVGYRRIEDAEKTIEALKPYGIDYFEDMLDASNEDSAELRRRTKARIMIDRQSYWPNVYEIVRAGAVDVVNHHPNNQGGLATALQIDAVATAAGLETAIGSCGLFGVQNAAYMQLASVIGLTRPCEDIGILPYAVGPTKGEYTFDDNPTVLRQSYPIEEGMIHIPDVPGLGLELDREQLRHFTVDQFEFA